MKLRLWASLNRKTLKVSKSWDLKTAVKQSQKNAVLLPTLFIWPLISVNNFL